MRIFISILFFAVTMLWSVEALSQQAPSTFNTAKRYMLEHVYYDRLETTYCGCPVTRRGYSGGAIEPEQCGYEYSAREAVRATRLEHEHIVPISTLTVGRPCGNRSQCEESDPVYRAILSNMFNLTLSVGDLNGKRSNLPFGELPHLQWDDAFGACHFKIDSRQRVVEPGDHVKGLISRTYFLMSWLYGMPLSAEQQSLFIRWNQAYPVTPWELQRNNRIASIMGYGNPFVTGELQWNGIISEFPAALGVYGDGREMYAQTSEQVISTQAPANDSGMPPFIGNKNSGIYFPRGCAFYERVAPRNRVPFNSEQEAIQSGFRAAKNC